MFPSKFFLWTKWSQKIHHAQRLGREKTNVLSWQYVLYNTRHHILKKLLSATCIWDKSGLTTFWLYIYCYILNFLAKKWLFLLKFRLIGYIHIGFSYLREKIATSGHLLHFYRNITTHCGQNMAKASYRSNLALSTHFGKFPKRSNMKPNILSKSFGKLRLGEQDWWEGTLIKLGDKDVSSTNGVRIDLVENANIHKHLHISDGICIIQI